MKLQEQIKRDLTAAMKAKDDPTKDALRVILGEFSRLENKDISDDDVIKILKKLIKSENEVLTRTGAADSQFITVCERYLPRMATDEEVRLWIGQNVDFARYKNKMQAMGVIMKHFGSTADGNAVKRILQDWQP